MRRFKSLLLVLPMMLALSTCAAPAYALTDGAEETPPIEIQPVETQPVEAPPVETPTETPPVETAPTETPPVEIAPTETPPVETAPTETPPTETIGQPGEIDLGDISQLGEIFPPEVWSELLKALLEGDTAQDCECCICQDRPHTCENCDCCDCCDCRCENCSKPVESAPVETPPATTTPKPTAATTPKPATTSTPKPTATTAPKPTETTEPKPVETELEKTPAQPLTPEGNLNLEDDIDGEAAEDKQFIVVQSRNGHYFYIIVDRAEDGENSVHFLNQVDEADLLALIEEEEKAPPVCSCTEKCVPGAVNTSCEICAVNMGECAGKEQPPEETDPPDEPVEPEVPEKPEKKGGTGPLLIVLVLAVAGVGAVVYLKFFKKKAPDTRGTANLDDYDYGTDDEDEDEPEDEDE